MKPALAASIARSGGTLKAVSLTELTRSLAAARSAPLPAFHNAMPADELGIVAVGGELTPAALVAAYYAGVFPWYETPPVQWFAPAVRMVLAPQSFHLTRSLRKWYQQTGSRLSCSVDTAFSRVIHACAQLPRRGQHGTWINADMIAAYEALAVMGIAHSVEIWQPRPPAAALLVGGLYGVSLGAGFFGESMFAVQPNSSKLALWLLCQFLTALQFTMIDCQLPTAHLASLGASAMPRQQFETALAASNQSPTLQGKWTQCWNEQRLIATGGSVKP